MFDLILANGGAFDDVDFNLSLITLPLLGILVIGLIAGIIFGLVRGFKRASYRLVTLLVFMTVAFFLTPPIARAMSNISLTLFDGRTFDEWVAYQSENDEVFAAALNNFGELGAVVEAMPAAIMSVFVFFGLLVIFRVLSWILYAATAWKFFPARKAVQVGTTANGMAKTEMRPTKRQRLLGMLMGVITAFVLFFFLMVPVNGMFNTLNRMSSYEPGFATGEIVIHNEDMRYMIEDIDILNDAIQGSVYGWVTRNTGMQWLGGRMFNHMTAIRTSNTRINVVDDAVLTFEVFKDFLAVYQNFYDENGGRLDAQDALRDMDPAYFRGMTQIVNKLFDIDFFRLIARNITNVASFLAEANLLVDDDGFAVIELFEESDRFPDLDATDIPDGWTVPVGWTSADVANLLFTEALLEALSKLNYNNVRTDLQNFVEIARVTFNQRAYQDQTLFQAVRGIADNFGQDGSRAEFQASAVLLQNITNESTLLYDLLHRVFGLSLFTVINDQNKETLPLVHLPLIYFGEFDKATVEDIPIDWRYVPGDINRILGNSAVALVGIRDIARAEDEGRDVLDVIGDLDPTVIQAIGRILNDLTMNIGLSPAIRELITDFIDEQDFDLDLGVPTQIDIQGIIDEILVRLNNQDIDWVIQLTTLQEAIILAGYLANFDLEDLEGLLDLIFSENFFNILKQDDLIGPIVVQQMEALINEMFDETFGLGEFFTVDFDYSREGFANTLDALYLLSTGMTSLITDISELQNLDEITAQDILDAFPNALLTFYEIVADGSPITINLNPRLENDFRDAVLDMYGSSHANNAWDVLEGLFGIGGRP